MTGANCDEGSSEKTRALALLVETAKQTHAKDCNKVRGKYNGLHANSREGNCTAISALLQIRMFPIDMIADGGYTPLIYAVQSGVPDAVKILLQNGANVEVVCDKGVTALIVSVEQGFLPAAKMLIQAGSDLEAMVINGDRSLHLAAGWGYTAVMTELVKAGANVNSRGAGGRTPLYISAKEGNLDAVKMLLRGKADPLLTAMGTDGLNVPLDMAAWHGKIDVVRELLRWGGVEGCGGGSGGVYALELAGDGEHLEIMAILTNAGVVDDGTALNTVTGKGRAASAKFLLQHQGKTNQGRPYVDNTCDVAGRTPFMRCYGPHSGFNGCKIAQMLIAHGADTTSPVPLEGAKGKAMTPLESIDMLATGVSAKMEQRLRNKGIRRLLLQAEAVRAVSWAWPVELAVPWAWPVELAVPWVWPVESTAPRVFGTLHQYIQKKRTTPLKRMLRTMRRTPSKPKVLLAAQIRYICKLNAPFLGYHSGDEDAKGKETDEQHHSTDLDFLQQLMAANPNARIWTG